jgi:hypothetical protein
MLVRVYIKHCYEYIISVLSQFNTLHCQRSVIASIASGCTVCAAVLISQRKHPQESPAIRRALGIVESLATPPQPS